ncbi:uncharacterized protein SETTUDRAFT_31245 [Exserohilum turcica Et28A]|uniref:Uncharacterized protein n=1 Tax=Exserohilum turcicum (strain 28A) TaxID=671987 RepID=R0KFN8_EXST2|nr:uncharacterized protein SETTUDRAFT_31245 [Exserohilum turcica Et28A]EOA86937.1 hypothetical protein SETTUDRAFT_31245 [Exserohilum turcica Et28A]
MSESYEQFILRDGVEVEVMEADMRQYLGLRATIRRGWGSGAYQGESDYRVTTDRPLTSDMMQELQASLPQYLGMVLLRANTQNTDPANPVHESSHGNLEATGSWIHPTWHAGHFFPAQQSSMTTYSSASPSSSYPARYPQELEGLHPPRRFTPSDESPVEVSIDQVMHNRISLTMVKSSGYPWSPLEASDQQYLSFSTGEPQDYIHPEAPPTVRPEYSSSTRDIQHLGSQFEGTPYSFFTNPSVHLMPQVEAVAQRPEIPPTVISPRAVRHPDTPM